MPWQNIKHASLGLLFVLLLLLGGGYYLFKEETAYYYQIDCRVYDQDMLLLIDAAGSYCSFLSDGSMIVGNATDLTYYDSHMRQVWAKSLSLHHLFNLSSDEKKIFIMKNSFHEYMGEKARFDDLQIIEIKTGNSLAEWSSFDNIDRMLKSVPWKYDKEKHRDFWTGTEPKEYRSSFEFFHFNSVYEIPENKLAKEFPFLKPKGIISNSGLGLVLFFDEHLKLLEILNIDDMQSVNTHDVQITPEGEMLFYRNQASNEHFSSLQKYDFRTKQVVYKFTGNDDLKSFYSWRLGSVQELSDRYLFSNLNDHGNIREISKDGRTLRSIDNPLTAPQTKKPRDMMRAKKLDLSSFIRNYQGF